MASDLPALVVVSLAGWLVGALSARATAALRTAHEPAQQGPRSWLLVDPLVQATLAGLWLLLALRWGLTTRWALAAISAVPLVQVAVTDLRDRYVYTVVALGGLVVGAIATPLAHGEPWWLGLAWAAAGYVAFSLLYLLGRLLYRGQEPLARGDSTIAAMVGAIAGPHTVTGLMSGVFLSGLYAIGVLIMRRTGRSYMPYGPGLCAGGLLTLFLP